MERKVSNKILLSMNKGLEQLPLSSLSVRKWFLNSWKVYDNKKRVIFDDVLATIDADDHNIKQTTQWSLNIKR